jgi:hypothetical protein
MRFALCLAMRIANGNGRVGGNIVALNGIWKILCERREQIQKVIYEPEGRRRRGGSNGIENDIRKRSVSSRRGEWGRGSA